jgi:NAD(P)H-nitrite reductase large subunit
LQPVEHAKGELKMKTDQPEKGAILQRDKETYAIKTHTPGGFINPSQLRRIAEVAEKYEIQAVKMTSAQRIALIGLPEDKLDEVSADLGDIAGAATGLCVHYVKICPGATYCKRGQQNSIAIGLKMDGIFHGMKLPKKFKMGVSGCQNDCSEVCIKDVGLIGTPKGWNVMVGGNGGAVPRFAVKLAEAVASEEAAFNLIELTISWFKNKERPCRVGKIVDEIGLEGLRKEIL